MKNPFFVAATSALFAATTLFAESPRPSYSHPPRYSSIRAPDWWDSGDGGLAYKGLVPTRDDDYTCFGVVYGKFSRNFARTVAESGDGYPDYELVFEWNYKVQLTNFAFLQPDLQWVINPGGTHRIPNALVLGAQMGVVF